MSIEFFWLISFISDHYLLQKVLIKMGFFSIIKLLFFIGACLSEIETKLFSKVAWLLTSYILLQISNLNWSLSNCLKLRYINFFGSDFSNFVLRILYSIVCSTVTYHMMMIIAHTTFKGLFINEHFKFVINQSMHETPSPLKRVFCFIIL